MRFSPFTLWCVSGEAVGVIVAGDIGEAEGAGLFAVVFEASGEGHGVVPDDAEVKTVAVVAELLAVGERVDLCPGGSVVCVINIRAGVPIIRIVCPFIGGFCGTLTGCAGVEKVAVHGFAGFGGDGGLLHGLLPPVICFCRWSLNLTPPV